MKSSGPSASNRGIDAGIPISDVILREDGKKLEPEEIARQVMERLKASLRADTYERRRLWPRSLLFTYGEQDLLWDYDAQQWLVRKVARTRSFKSNMLQARLAAFVAGLTQHRPALSAIPINDDLDNVRQAKLGERVFAFDWRDLKIGRARYHAMLDCAIFGTGIMEVGWDQYAGDIELEYEEQIGPDGEPLLDEMGNPLPVLDSRQQPIVKSRSYSGHPFVRARSPFSFFVPPGLDEPSLDPSVCPWIIDVTWMSEAQIRKVFSDKREGGLVDKDFELGSTDPEFNQLEPLSTYLSRYSMRGATKRDELGQHLVVRYMQPSCAEKGFEQGRVYTCVGGKLVGDHPGLLDQGRYPFVLFPWMPRRGRFWSAGWIEPQCDPQARYNQTLSHLMTLLAIFTNPALMIPKGSGLPQTLSFNLQGYYYNPSAGMASFLTPPQPNNAIYEMQNRSVQDLDRTGGQYAFSRGEPTPNVPSALYAQVMVDKDNTELGPAMREHALAFEDLGSMLVEIHHSYDSAERLIHVVGESNRPELVAFRGSQLPAQLRFICAETSMATSIPAVQLQKIKELMQMGLITPKDQPVAPQMRKALLNYAELGELTEAETGTRVLDKFVERTMSAVIEEGQDVLLPTPPEGKPGLNPLWKPPVLAALATALDERVLREDVPKWDPETVQRVMAFQAALGEGLQAAADAEEAEQEKQVQKQVAVEAQLQAIKSKGRIAEKVSGETAKAGLEVIKNEAMPPAPPPGNNGGPPSDGGGAPAPGEQ